MAYISGIDVSSVQGIINWDAVASTGVEFAIIKCYQGNSGLDPFYNINISGATNAGLKTMCYQFVYPLPTNSADPNRDPVDQANLHFNASNGQIAVCDLEWPVKADWARWGVNATFINDWTLQYLEAYSNLAGRLMLVYTYPNYAQNVGLTSDFATYPLWIASYETVPTIPPPWQNWALWQTTGGSGHLPSGAPVDTDVARDLTLWTLDGD